MLPSSPTSGRDPRFRLLLPACFALAAVVLGASSVAEESVGLLHASRSALVIGFVGLRRASAALLDAPDVQRADG